MNKWASFGEVEAITDGIEIGAPPKCIDTPSNLANFRAILHKIAKRDSKKFITRVKGSQLFIIRVKFINVDEKIGGSL